MSLFIGCSTSSQSPYEWAPYTSYLGFPNTALYIDEISQLKTQSYEELCKEVAALTIEVLGFWIAICLVKEMF